MRRMNVHTGDSRPLSRLAGDGRPSGATMAESTESGEPNDRATAAEAACVPGGFDAVYSQHFDFVCRSLRLLGVARQGLEDAAQDVFGVVSRRLPDFVPDAPVRTWLFAIVQRVAANHRRAWRRKQSPLEPLCEPLPARDPGPDAHAEATQAAELIERFAHGLDDGHRAVLILALIERAPAREVATALGIPLFTVYSRIRAVRGRLEAFLDAEEVET
jgi:RNA polymerase sigma-70 factor (ECF subfamily)